jgi:hypothetical protein
MNPRVVFGQRERTEQLYWARLRVAISVFPRNGTGFEGFPKEWERMLLRRYLTCEFASPRAVAMRAGQREIIGKPAGW